MARASLSLAFVLLAGCTCSDASELPPRPSAPTAQAAAEPPAADAKAAPPPLSEEDQRLLAADPATLSPEDRRKRAFALRRKIMQNPDSPTARMLEDLRKAQEDGELEVPKPGETPHFEARTPGSAPQGGPPPAGSRPAAGARPTEPATATTASGAP